MRVLRRRLRTSQLKKSWLAPLTWGFPTKKSRQRTKEEIYFRKLRLTGHFSKTVEARCAIGKTFKKSTKKRKWQSENCSFLRFFCPWLDYRGGSSDLYSMRKVAVAKGGNCCRCHRNSCSLCVLVVRIDFIL